MNSEFYQYISQRQWTKAPQSRRRVFMHRMAKDSQKDKDFASKIGGILIYNQVIQQYLEDIVKASLYYIRAKIWPARVELDGDLDGATFGKVIDYFRQYAIVEKNREQLLSDLKKFNIKRNQVAHDLFDVEDLRSLYEELADYARLADDMIALLEDYDTQVCQNFYQLEKSGALKRIKNR